MTNDMLRFASEGEGVRGEAFADGEAAPSIAAPPTVASPPTAAMTSAAAPSVAMASSALSPASGPAICKTMDLRALVTRAVVPRLAAHFRAQPTLPTSVPPLGEVDDRSVGDIVDALLRDDLACVCRFVEAARAAGRSLDRIYLELLAPAAAAVARLACADDCPPAADTLAFSNLQLVLRRYAADFYEEGGTAPQGTQALLVPTRAVDGAAAGLPTFGLLLAADFLRRAGWEAWIEPSLQSASLLETVRTQWFDLVQVLVDGALDADEVREVAAGIQAIRRDGANAHVVVVACGPSLAHDSELVARLGADRGVSDPLAILSSSGGLLDHASQEPANRRRHLS